MGRYESYRNSGDLHCDLVDVVNYARELAAKQSPERSRELSLVVTKLEEALLWTKAHIETFREKKPDQVDQWAPGWWSNQKKR